MIQDGIPQKPDRSESQESGFENLRGPLGFQIPPDFHPWISKKLKKWRLLKFCKENQNSHLDFTLPEF